MTGLTEILLLIFLILAVLIVPRLLSPSSPKPASERLISTGRLTPLIRTGLVLSLAYPVVMLLILTPWQNNAWIRYLTIGILPVLAVWSVVWILKGRPSK